MLTESFPRVILSHTPTPLERLDNLSADYQTNIWIKRDDCTGLAFGGNKSRQLEFYIGHARSLGADMLLTTGAVQSNHVRMTVAAARKMDMEVEVQLEHRVDRDQPEYHKSGNPFLVKLMGAKIHYYPLGEDEDGADQAMVERAEELKKAGKQPYVIPLSNARIPYGALGYVDAAEETLKQLEDLGISPMRFFLPTGSASTHAGFLLGLVASSCSIPVQGVCVRREAVSQQQRVLTKIDSIAELMSLPMKVVADQVICDDRFLAPGYGHSNTATQNAIELLARREGILLDPTYSGKAFAAVVDALLKGDLGHDDHIVFLHTGGTPSLFAYPELVSDNREGFQI
ncbi:MAG: D-cysteine desulfhydrase family protein [Gammaproteobacteria bacterium]|nr:D-cysteine desulfhydrase family protein [Gammaproteobacteria bacterium]